MDQKELRELERSCIQEEAPTCTARCPIHVDVRSFLKRAALGDWDEALNILAITMPFPKIVARICEHPCELVCLRIKAGGAIAISDLEKTAVGLGHITKHQVPMPKKEYRVAIAGSGLSSLVVAWVLAYKGYRIFFLEKESQIGKVFWGMSERILPKIIIDEEMANLKRLGIEYYPILQMEEHSWFDYIVNSFDAVYVGLDTVNKSFFEGVVEGTLPINPLTLATSRDGLFVGGKFVEGNLSLSIELVAEGKRAAVSIDRFIQKVSLVTGREHEGPYETRLFTSLEGVEPLPRIIMECPSGYSEAEARNEAARCIQCECMECVKACLYLRSFKSYPKRYIREIYNNETILIGSHGHTNKLINSCTLCTLCEVICPNGISMAPICLEGRIKLVSKGKMPPSAHEFAIEDMKYSNSEKIEISFHEPGKDRSDFVFFPGCQLGATYPEHVISAYAYLRKTFHGGVGLILRCCGAPAQWAGNLKLFEDSIADLTKKWEKLGNPIIVTACPTCYRILKKYLPQADVTTLWEMLDDSTKAIDNERTYFSETTLAVHDPCTTRYEPAIQESVRRILIRLGYTLEELNLTRNKTECCGFGGLVSNANPELAQEMAKNRSARSKTDYVTYCAQCRNALAYTGKRILHLLDLIFEGTPDSAGRRVPGLSERRENRYRLKQKLLKELWAEEMPMEEHEKIILHIPPEVMSQMEKRRILIEDVQKTVNYAEKTGNKLFNPTTGHFLASFKPANVTYWAEYSLEGEGQSSGFRIYNAYSHRMEVVRRS